MTARDRSILVAEDHPFMATVVRVCLEKAGFDVTVAADGAEAWQLTRGRKFDLILTDYQMPQMTGLDLCRKLRDDDDYAEVPVILMTAFGRGADLGPIKDELGIQVIYDKPCRLNDMVATIERCLAEAEAIR